MYSHRKNIISVKKRNLVYLFVYIFHKSSNYGTILIRSVRILRPFLKIQKTPNPLNMEKPDIAGAVKASLTIRQVLERYGLFKQMRPIRRGDPNNFEGPCPIHLGSSPTQFKVSVSKNVWQCFSQECKCGGNVLDLVAKIEGITLQQAAQKLNELFKLGLGLIAPKFTLVALNAPEDLIKDLRQLALDKGVPFEKHVRSILDEHVAKNRAQLD